MKTKLLLLLTLFTVFVHAEIIGSGIININSTRTYDVNEQTIYYLDGSSIDYAAFEIIGSGFKSTYTLSDDANSSLTTGTINEIELVTNLQGPVTSLNPFSVLGQPVLTTAETKNVITAKLQVGDIVAISGYLNANNSLKATRLMSATNSLWKIRGYVDSDRNKTLMIGNQSFNTQNITNKQCAKGSIKGKKVEIIMAENPLYSAGDVLENVMSVRCLTTQQLSNPNQILPTVLQGFVNKKQGNTFWVDDIEIQVDNSTIYTNGESNFVDVGVNVEIQGVMDTNNSTLVANSVHFIEDRIEITFPINPQDVTANEKVIINGVDFYFTPQSKDLAQISNGISRSKQVQIQGYIDSNGVIYISRTLNKGAVNLNNVSLRGNVKSIDSPLFSVFDFDIDTSTSNLMNLSSVNEFFNLLQVGTQVEIKNASYNSQNNQLSNAVIKIREASSNKKSNNTKEIIGSGIVGGFGSATISSTNSALFHSSFEQ